MNAPTPAALFSAVEMAPRDPILGITEAYVADKNPNKVNLGVGVYYDENGKVPLLKCVQKAEALMTEQALPRNYIPIDGLAAYDKAVQELVFGADNPVIQEKRAITVQAIGGTGALKLGADFLKRLMPQSQVWISNPSWENHRALFESAGFVVNSYRYYDAATRGVDFAGMLADLKAMPQGGIALLHACCHNPTGADLSTEQWDEVIKVVKEKGLVPFLDMAYQGFGDGIAEDGAVVRRFTEAGGPLFVSNSFSKSISLYGERVGALSIVAADAAEAARVLSQMKRVVRTNYSSPPMHSGQVVAMTLTNPELRKTWEEELAGMRVRIKEMRKLLVEKLKQKAPAHNFDFVIKQRGMFSYSGLTKEQVGRLQAEYSIYAIDTGRICIAALNTKNIDYVTDAIAKVL
ncbi:amino acid aminotransferase [Lacisediminimonas profundi]|uniref:amino acid aminotransferase n=1 Tax=Lacisediminimonas profundi TaxID=2603856 RepID=UPI00124B344B|nr:amino acid aminotransferase [Lacisediminimonas profundi]